MLPAFLSLLLRGKGPGDDALLSLFSLCLIFWPAPAHLASRGPAHVVLPARLGIVAPTRHTE